MALSGVSLRRSRQRVLLRVAGAFCIFSYELSAISGTTNEGMRGSEHERNCGIERGRGGDAAAH